MARLCKIMKINFIHKRFMEAQQEKPKDVSNLSDNETTTILQNPPANEEIQVDANAPQYGQPPSVPEPPQDRDYNTTSWFSDLGERIKAFLKPKNRPIQENPAAINTIGNETVDNRFSTDIAMPLASYKFHTQEAEIVDRMLRGIVTSLEICDKKLNLEIEKSDTLRLKWQELIVQSDKLMDTYNKATQPFWKKKWFTVSASLLTLGFFLFQMYKYKALPNFIGLLADLGESMFKTTSKDSTSNIATSIPELDLSKTLKVIGETPLAPSTILIGVGLGTTIIVALKIARFILRK
jgi:hypothetical protein